MENTPLSNYRSLANRLAKIMNDNNILFSTCRDQFYQTFIEYVKEESLKGMEECIKIFHKIYNHQDSYIVLSCKFRHCIECYSYFTQEYFDSNKLFCTCSIKITPKFKSLIISNYERIQSLRTYCSICYTVKDKMNFPAINTHKSCVVCYSCIKGNYVYEKNRKNNCIMCGRVYDEESEISIRNCYEENLHEDAKKAFYLEACMWCKENKDSRDFSIVCGDNHVACVKCVNEMTRNKEEVCFCGLQISIIPK